MIFHFDCNKIHHFEEKYFYDELFSQYTTVLTIYEEIYQIRRCSNMKSTSNVDHLYFSKQPCF